MIAEKADADGCKQDHQNFYGFVHLSKALGQYVFRVVGRKVEFTICQA
jgi:hypothetical protein